MLTVSLLFSMFCQQCQLLYRMATIESTGIYINENSKYLLFNSLFLLLFHEILCFFAWKCSVKKCGILSRWIFMFDHIFLVCYWTFSNLSGWDKYLYSQCLHLICFCFFWHVFDNELTDNRLAIINFLMKHSASACCYFQCNEKPQFQWMKKLWWEK